MKLSLGVALLLTSIMAGLAQAQQPTGIVTMEALRDRSRPLLVFATRPDDPQLEIQLRTLAEHEPAATERQIVAIALPYHAPQPTAAKLSEHDAEQVRRRFNIAPGEFTVILIGKDGGEKLRSHKPLTMERLNATIDAMPMRQDEMHRR